MRRIWIRKPHRLVLIAAGVALVVGVALLIVPEHGVLTLVGWILAIGAVVSAALALFLVRTPPS